MISTLLKNQQQYNYNGIFREAILFYSNFSITIYNNYYCRWYIYLKKWIEYAYNNKIYIYTIFVVVVIVHEHLAPP